jgi:sugar phosphate permease
MKGLDCIWLGLAFAAVVLAAGIPYWRLPYDEINRGHFAILPGALLLGFLTLLLVAAEVARVKAIAVTMLLCVPAIDVVSIVKDTTADPTSHNLWPFELAIAAISGALVVVPAMLAGLAARWAMRRMA